MKALKTFIIVLGGMVTTVGCTKLDESLNGSIPQNEFKENADIPGLLKSCYTAMYGPFQDQTGIWCLQDMTSDDAIGPTRGGDWDDNGVWRVLHTQKWDAENQRIRDNFSNLLQIVFLTTDIQNYNPPADVAAQAYMLRAWVTYNVFDLYNKVPFRQVGSDLNLPPEILEGQAAIDQIQADIDKALPDLGDGPANKSNKWAAKAILMKLYLNRGAFLNRKAPTFDAADMQKVISLADEIINSGKFALESDFYSSFIPKNTETSKEIIFANENTTTEAGNVRFHWHAGTHYNQNPSGWNGFTTLANFYDKFEDQDQRKGKAYTGFTDKVGMRVGFLVGQQYGKDNVALVDRGGNPLVFTRDITPIVDGNVELPGIRVVKYVPDMKSDYSGDKDIAENDYVFLRYSDVLLMKAEALLRTGNAEDALDIVNEIRVKRGATALATLDLDKLLDERGRELYWESWRRNDLIRFGKFLDPFGPTKPEKSDDKYLLFPIPNAAKAANPALEQNPGY
ncbi:RagB/SusD family nutrient uptake outer membrane protein [Flavihumibacter petaseus]|uniref:RagB/SusD domain-containing protein n=1 Tax=Flavihumibacter petaseus NBRC 106054 TaxID=1220578 RepID=A0A0E9N5H1_9BACT|nr:RagB/SusD family nutrient uptake outer membrane protein [Flavihumibacter petaseus]GAO45053.1 hypothetical protein FPE01S_04_02960 [Flavihumibacter petaseus NBRC 106054]